MKYTVEAINKATGIAKDTIWLIILVLFTTLLVLAVRDALSNRRSKKQSKIANRIVADVEKTALSHAKTLSRKKAQLVYYEDYGEVELGAYHRELNTFYDKIVWPVIANDMNAMGLAGYLPSRETNLNIIAKTVENHDATHSTDQIEVSQLVPTDPIAYETWCATQLKANGWNARTTKASGDQGADVIAEKNGRTLVVQCKRHSSDVGNKAVQEVIAARTFYRATDAPWSRQPASQKVPAEERTMPL